MVGSQSAPVERLRAAMRNHRDLDPPRHDQTDAAQNSCKVKTPFSDKLSEDSSPYRSGYVMARAVHDQVAQEAKPRATSKLAGGIRCPELEWFDPLPGNSCLLM